MKRNAKTNANAANAELNRTELFEALELFYKVFAGEEA